ncbi:permease [bacterium]|nr:permease [bacterium]
MRREGKALVLVFGAFLLFYFLPASRFQLPGPLLEGLLLAQDYAREHVILCLVPAFFIAGAISIFLDSTAVMRFLGPRAPKTLAYGVASISGGILAVCSCTVLPIFAGIHGMGAGLGPATAFLYSGPAINVLAIVLTSRILGPGLGIARVIGAVVFSVLIGVIMHLMFRRSEMARAESLDFEDEASRGRPLGQTILFVVSLVAILVFANLGHGGETGPWHFVFQLKWILTSAFALCLGLVILAWYGFRLADLLLVGLPVATLALIPGLGHTATFAAGTLLLAWRLHARGGELSAWLDASWGFAKQILPLLLGGVLVAGLLLGRPGHEGFIPASWVTSAVGGNSLGANFFASLAGAFMYFATLTEVPILQGLLGSGMGKGPALALLLAGPALSLPNMLVIASVIGARKTVAFVGLVVVMATITGWIYGFI